ncbi:MAG TPA: acyloxyacyl hydrolase [Acidobacteriaceae bacterium]|nr:acyloxyacyl hydrolase [Acidobacteriaceae bacterium]
MRPLITGLLALALLAPALCAQTQAQSPYYDRGNTLGIFAAYSNDSSHILLGQAEQRKILNIGASYTRRILVGRVVNWQYSGELLPVALESDPLSRETVQQVMPTAATLTYVNQDPLVQCAPTTIPYNIELPNGEVFAGTETYSCFGRRWTIGEAISPVGFQWNFMPRRRLEPFLSAHGGYMYSTRPIPIDDSGSFNFTFDFGAGLELYRSHSQSIRVEYRYHHISNHGTAYENPGIDNGVVQLSWTLGR